MREVQVNSNSNVSLENLLSATIKFKQYFALDFAKLANFPYISQLKSANLNLSLYAYGSIKHLLALSDGTLPPVSKEEYNSRLRHCLNVLEITCLGSNLTDFNSHSWRIAKEYDLKKVKDIEQGYKTWESLDKCIDPTAWTYAREMVPPSKPKENSNQNVKSQSQNSQQKFCTTYNTFRNGNGCSYEYSNPGETCVYQHSCSNCRQKGFPNRRHKSIHCREDNSQTNNSINSNSTVTSSVSVSAPVVTSV